MTLRERVLNVLFSFDCFTFSLITFGRAYPFESWSAAAWRAENMGKAFGMARPVIDAFFRLFGETDHCRKAFENAYKNLPPESRP